MKRIEKTKNRVKSELEITIKISDSKNAEIVSVMKKNGIRCHKYWYQTIKVSTNTSKTKTIV